MDGDRPRPTRPDPGVYEKRPDDEDGRLEGWLFDTDITFGKTAARTLVLILGVAVVLAVVVNVAIWFIEDVPGGGIIVTGAVLAGMASLIAWALK